MLDIVNLQSWSWRANAWIDAFDHRWRFHDEWTSPRISTPGRFRLLPRMLAASRTARSRRRFRHAIFSRHVPPDGVPWTLSSRRRGGGLARAEAEAHFLASTVSNCSLEAIATRPAGRAGFSSVYRDRGSPGSSSNAPQPQVPPCVSPSTRRSQQSRACKRNSSECRHLSRQFPPVARSITTTGRERDHRSRITSRPSGSGAHGRTSNGSSLSTMPVLVKGILSPKTLCWRSNIGRPGRLEPRRAPADSVAPVTMLASVVDAVAGACQTRSTRHSSRRTCSRRNARRTGGAGRRRCWG